MLAGSIERVYSWLRHGGLGDAGRPAPGYLAIEIAKLGRFQMSGLDISRTFVEIASENARRVAVNVEEGSFDLIVCQAAFKNFAEPVRALDEMQRVLHSSATAVIQDLSKDASWTDIDREVKGMKLAGSMPS
jgi:ubiquinone/menaquinone biosynthesis C-methylase UbiE